MGARVKRIVAVLAQAAGALMVVWAVAELAGTPWAVGVAGAGLIGYGVLAEAGWI
jgi:hypothetical protein